MRFKQGDIVRVRKNYDCNINETSGKQVYEHLGNGKIISYDVSIDRFKVNWEKTPNVWTQWGEEYLRLVRREN